MTEKTVPDAIMNAVQAGQEYHAKVMQFAAANTQAALDYFQKLAATRAASEVIELTATPPARAIGQPDRAGQGAGTTSPTVAVKEWGEKRPLRGVRRRSGSCSFACRARVAARVSLPCHTAVQFA